MTFHVASFWWSDLSWSTFYSRAQQNTDTLMSHSMLIVVNKKIAPLFRRSSPNCRFLFCFLHRCDCFWTVYSTRNSRWHTNVSTMHKIRSRRRYRRRLRSICIWLRLSAHTKYVLLSNYSVFGVCSIFDGWIRCFAGLRTEVCGRARTTLFGWVAAGSTNAAALR